MPSCEELKRTIKSIGPDPEAYKRKEIKELPNLLQEDEEIKGAVSGTPEIDGEGQGGQYLLVATDRRILFIDKGMLFGLTVKDIPYGKISSVQYKKGLLLGQIEIVTSNTHIKVKNIFNMAVVPFHNIVQKALDGNYSKEKSDKQLTDDDLVQKLERLTNLKKAGALTAAEFEVAKRRLLS